MDIALLKDRYYGDLAATYDDLRIGTPLWKREDKAIRSIISSLQAGSSLLDVPIGTGRFLSLCREFDISVHGVDASTEMLAQARKKSREVGIDVPLNHGDIRSLPFADRSFDTAMCVRFLNWVDEANLKAAVQELTRVSRKTVVIGLRTYRDLSEVNLTNLQDIKNYLRQFKLRFYHFRTRSDFIYHEAAAARAVFAECELAVIQKIRIPTPLPGDYSIYLAERTS